MNIKKAVIADLGTVYNITQNTIREIYPEYYPCGAVEFFCKHHCTENILKDIQAGFVYLAIDDNENIVGTVTVKENEIARLFVLPQYQGNGYGGKIIDFAENQIFSSYDDIILDASLPAKAIYLKRQYVFVEYNIITTDNGDRLCYDVMQKNSL